MTRSETIRRTLAALLYDAALPLLARAATPAELEAGYTAQAGAPANAERGQQFFTTRHGREWSCSSCHGAAPTRAGSHAATGKAIAALKAEGFGESLAAGTLDRPDRFDALRRPTGVPGC